MSGVSGWEDFGAGESAPEARFPRELPCVPHSGPRSLCGGRDRPCLLRCSRCSVPPGVRLSCLPRGPEPPCAHVRSLHGVRALGAEGDSPPRPPKPGLLETRAGGRLWGRRRGRVRLEAGGPVTWGNEATSRGSGFTRLRPRGQSSGGSAELLTDSLLFTWPIPWVTPEAVWTLGVLPRVGVHPPPPPRGSCSSWGPLLPASGLCTGFSSLDPEHLKARSSGQLGSGLRVPRLGTFTAWAGRHERLICDTCLPCATWPARLERWHLSVGMWAHTQTNPRAYCQQHLCTHRGRAGTTAPGAGVHGPSEDTAGGLASPQSGVCASVGFQRLRDHPASVSTLAGMCP